MIEESTFSLVTSDDITLKGRVWQRESQSPYGVVCIVHGLGEHMGRYDHFAEFLVDSKMIVYAYDQRGHGLSEGKRGHTPSFEVLLDDLELVLKYIKQSHNLPVMLFGHSFGGCVVSNYILNKEREEVLGAIISSPWLRLNFDPPKFKFWLGKLLNKIYPSFSQPNGLDADDLTHDTKVNEAYKSDPLVHNRITTRLFFSTYEAGIWALEHTSEVNIPVLITHGTLDNITSMKASIQFAAEAGDKVMLKLWDNLKHEPHNEINKSEVFEYIRYWLIKEIQLARV